MSQHAFQITVTKTFSVVLDNAGPAQAREIAYDLDVASLTLAANGGMTEWDSNIVNVADVAGSYTVTAASVDGILTVSLCGEDEDAPGILHGCDSDEGIQRCDDCDWYAGDLEAAAALAQRFPGAVVRWNGDDGQVHTGTDVPDGVMLAPENEGNPWLELDGTPIDFTTTSIPPLTTNTTTES